MTHIAHPTQQRGSTILEALVAILIFSIGVLAVVALQAVMIKDSTGAKYRADASFLASELIGTMWGDTSHVSEYDTGGATYQPRDDWLNLVSNTLASGTASVAVAASSAGGSVSNNVTITLKWTPPNDVQHQYVATTTISPQ